MTNVGRFVFVAAVAAVSGAVDASAHHSYAAFDRCKPIALEGEIDNVEWANPHIVIELRAKDVGPYRIEWFALGQLAQADIAAGTLQTGAQHECGPSVHSAAPVFHIRRQSRLGGALGRLALST